jgi:hypothetical protein
VSRAKRVRKARSAARRARRDAKTIADASSFFVEARERATARKTINESDAPDALKKVFSFLIDPAGFVFDELRKYTFCPRCYANSIVATLRATVTARGEVQRCWQCGGEYRDGKLVWPEAS